MARKSVKIELTAACCLPSHGSGHHHASCLQDAALALDNSKQGSATATPVSYEK